MKCRLKYHFLPLSLSLLQLLSTSGDSWTLPQSDLTSEFNVQFLSQVLRNVNESVEPCEDFYGYACGKWSENYKDTEHYLDMPGYMDYKYNLQLLSALETHRQQQGGIYEQAWCYYKSCRDLRQPALNGMLHLLEAELYLEWPIFRAQQHEVWHNESQFDWLATLARLRLYGLNGVFIKQDINVRRENGSHYVILLTPQPDAQAAGTQFEEQAIQDLYVAFGLNETLAKNLTAKLMQLEWRLGNMTCRLAVSETSELTMQQLRQQLPQIDWQHYLNTLLVQPPLATQLLQVSAAFNADYVQQLHAILAQSSNETICSYLMFKLLYTFNVELPPTGANESISSMVCMLQLRGHMPLAMNYVYEQHFYGVRREQTDAALQRLQLKLRWEFVHLLQENRLQLTKAEQDYVLEELLSLRLKIGNIPPNLTRKELLLHYKDLQLRDNDFYGNKLQLLRLYQRHEQRQLANVPGMWPEHDYYYQDAGVARSSSPVKIFHNAVLLPQAYLQLPLYDAQLAELLQHAQLGFILAHEMQHAFDLFHIVYDARSNYNATGLGMLQHFTNFSNCYVKQATDEPLLSETMSDLVGLRLAHAAYFDHVLADKRPIGKHTQEQLFFINSVQFLCANMRQIANMSTTEDVEHGLHNERVNRNWPHFEKFAEAFNCAAGQAMYQSQPCRLW